MSGFLKIFLYAAIVYGGVVAIAYAAQRKLMYFPDATRIEPARLGLEGVREIELQAPDGARIIAWYAPAPAGQPTLLYFHGNGGNLAGRALRLARYQNARLGVFMVSWRSYSGSTGIPSERVNVADARLGYDYLTKLGVLPTDIILYGESLGTGVAVQLATSVPVAGVALDAPYTSTVDLGAKAYPFLPVRWLMHDRYESARRIAGISTPLLILHGARDTVIPVAMGQRLHALAREPKKLILFPNGNHVDLDQHGAVDELRKWIDEIRK
jgi:fermentation-respiration switch protein FrsA (DUF1100 family)